MVKVNTNSLKDSIGQSLGIKPINLDDTVDAGDDDVVFIIQYPQGKDQYFSTSVCFFADGKSLINGA